MIRTFAEKKKRISNEASANKSGILKKEIIILSCLLIRWTDQIGKK